MVDGRPVPLGILIGRIGLALLPLCIGTLAGCASPRNEALDLAARRQLRPGIIPAGTFDLFTLAPTRFTPGVPLSIYIEGDGFAWRDRYRLSDDPTPRNPVALKLAVADPGPNVVYIARPCQYVSGPNRRNCHPAYWSTARFAETVIAAIGTAIDAYAADSGTSGLRLTGYSGGGAVAVLLAARRTDVLRVVTVAGVLDTDAWTRLDDSTPLVHSLNPADTAERIAGIPQLHLVGAEDKVVPPAVAQSFARRFPPDRRPEVRIVPGQGHECCWAEGWPSLLARIDGILRSP